MNKLFSRMGKLFKEHPYISTFCLVHLFGYMFDKEIDTPVKIVLVSSDPVSEEK